MKENKNENRLLALLRLMYRNDEQGCYSCCNHDGYSCRTPEKCKWEWEFEQEVAELGIEKELITMSLEQAIATLDGCIPHPADNMVDREHIEIAIAWSVIKAEVFSKDASEKIRTEP